MAEYIKIIIHIEADPDTEIIGIKEDFAAYCEKFGDVRRIEVESVGADNGKENQQ